jgi:hypothetical protein
VIASGDLEMAHAGRSKCLSRVWSRPTREDWVKPLPRLLRRRPEMVLDVGFQRKDKEKVLHVLIASGRRERERKKEVCYQKTSDEQQKQISIVVGVFEKLIKQLFVADVVSRHRRILVTLE